MQAMRLHLNTGDTAVLNQCLITLIIAGYIALCSGAAYAQGTVNFYNRVQPSVVAPVYSQNPANPGVQQLGNSPEGTPAGTTIYGGVALSGVGYTAQLWGAPGANQPESALVPAAGYCKAVFRTGQAAGYWVPSIDPAIIPGAPEGSVATLQVRVWNNSGGTITTWTEAIAAGVESGSSPLFNSYPLGGLSAPPPLGALRSFSLTSKTLPTPMNLQVNQTNGVLHFVVVDDSQAPVGLEMWLSHNLRDWRRLGTFAPGNRATFYSDFPNISDSRPRFYRAIPALVPSP